MITPIATDVGWCCDDDDDDDDDDIDAALLLWQLRLQAIRLTGLIL